MENAQLNGFRVMVIDTLGVVPICPSTRLSSSPADLAPEHIIWLEPCINDHFHIVRLLMM